MRITYSILFCIGLSLVPCGHICWGQFPEVPEEAIEALGKTAGTLQSNGFVFVEGRYLRPPYTVTRNGNGIFINRVQVEQPFAWKTEILTPVVISSIQKPGDAPEGTEIATNVADTATAAGNSGDAPAGKTLDALFDNGSAQPVTEEKAAASVEKKADPVILTQKQKDRLCQELDNIRLRFELGLAQGEIFLFNYKNGRINGTYGTAKALFAVLPEAVRYAQSPQDLMVRLNQGGVSFLDINACTDLYRNKLNFMVLSDRRRTIEVNELKTYQLRPR